MGQFEPERAAELAESYHASAEQVRKLIELSKRKDIDVRTVSAGAGSLVRQATLLKRWISSGERSPPPNYALMKSATDALILNRRREAPATGKTAIRSQVAQLRIISSRMPDGSSGPLGRMTVTHTIPKVPERIRWVYPGGASDAGFGIALPKSGMLAASFGKGVKSLHIYHLGAPGSGSVRMEGLWAPTIAGSAVEAEVLLATGTETAPTNFRIESGGTLSIGKRTDASVLEVKWSRPTGETTGIGVISGNYLAAIVTTPGVRGGVALYSMTEDGSKVPSRCVMSESDGVGAEQLVVTKLPTTAKPIRVPPADIEAEIRVIAEAIREDLGNAAR